MKIYIFMYLILNTSLRRFYIDINISTISLVFFYLIITPKIVEHRSIVGNGNNFSCFSRDWTERHQIWFGHIWESSVMLSHKLIYWNIFFRIFIAFLLLQLIITLVHLCIKNISYSTLQCLDLFIS